MCPAVRENRLVIVDLVVFTDVCRVRHSSPSSTSCPCVGIQCHSAYDTTSEQRAIVTHSVTMWGSKQEFQNMTLRGDLGRLCREDEGGGGGTGSCLGPGRVKKGRRKGSSWWSSSSSSSSKNITKPAVFECVDGHFFSSMLFISFMFHVVFLIFFIV